MACFGLESVEGKACVYTVARREGLLLCNQNKASIQGLVTASPKLETLELWDPFLILSGNLISNNEPMNNRSLCENLL